MHSQKDRICIDCMDLKVAMRFAEDLPARPLLCVTSGCFIIPDTIVLFDGLRIVRLHIQSTDHQMKTYSCAENIEILNSE